MATKADLDTGLDGLETRLAVGFFVRPIAVGSLIAGAIEIL